MSPIATNSVVGLEREAGELLEMLRRVRQDIEMSVINMENSKKDRDKRRKEILLKEMKIILAKLDQEDKTVMGELKGEAFDLLRLSHKFEEELQSLAASDLRSLQMKVERVGFQTFVDCLNLSVGSVPSGSMSFMEEVTDSIYLKTPSFSAKSFLLVIPEKSPQFDRSNPEINPHHLEVQVHGSRDGPVLHPFLLKRLTVSVSCAVQGSLGTSRAHCLEESSLWGKLEKREGELVDGNTFKFFIKRPKNTLCKISVKLLTSNISNSPLTFQFLNEAQSDQPTVASLAVNETGIEIFDDDVDTLGLVPRQPLLTMLPTVSHIPASPRMTPELLKQVQSGLPVAALAPPHSVLPQPSDLSPFRPPTEAVSTLKPSAAGTLAEALEALGTNGLEYAEVEGPEKSILDPSKRSNLSVEDMQRSLSGSESGDRSAYGLEVDTRLDKSHVSFAATCQVVSVVATPQVAAGGERFLVSDGQTKETDGQAGVTCVRRLPVKGEDEEDNSWNKSEAEGGDGGEKKADGAASDGRCPEQNEIEGCDGWNKSELEGGQDCDVTVPLDDEEDSADTDDIVESRVDCEDQAAPSPSSLNGSLPHLDSSLWSLVSPASPDKFDFIRGCEEVASYGNIPVHSSSALTCPHDIAYIPQRHCFLVSEPYKNRIGIYEAESFKFVEWLPHPKCYRRFERPTSILSASNGNVFILVRDKIEILDPKLNGYQFKVGSYAGLTEGESGEIFTLTLLRQKAAYYVQRLSLGPNNFYKFTGQRCLHIIGNFENHRMSRPRHLTYSNKKLFISDIGLHKFYSVDLVTDQQKPFGYYGTSLGQLNRPAGIICDDSGHILVASGNNSLLVFSQAGTFIKAALQGDEDFSNLRDIRRFKDFLIVMKTSCKERPTSGRVMWYRLKGTSQ